MKVSTDTIYRVWNDDQGVCLEIGPDADGIGIEISPGTKESQDWFGSFNIALGDKAFCESLGEALIEMARNWPTR